MREKIFNPLNTEVKLNYDSVADLAKKMGVSRQWVIIFLQNLKEGKGMNLKTLENFCGVLGYELIAVKKKAK